MTSSFFFFNDTATTEIYTLSLHDALPISPAGGAGTRRTRILERVRHRARSQGVWRRLCDRAARAPHAGRAARSGERSEEHTSELQSPDHLVCRLLLEKKKNPDHRLKQPLY